MDQVAFLKELVSIPSPSGEEDAVAGYLVEQMTALGFRARRDEVGNVVGVLGDPEAEREIVLLGHMDTVPGNIPVRLEGGRLYGRGAVDAKGPLATFVLAAARAASRLSGARLVVIGAVEEEIHGRGASHLARTMQPPGCVFIGEPSGWQGITLGYKGMLSVDYRLVKPCSHSAGMRPAPAELAFEFWRKVEALALVFNRGRERPFEKLDPSLRSIHTFSNGLDDWVEMSIVLRLPPGTDVPSLQRQMAGWCEGAVLTFPNDDPPFLAEKNTPPVRALLQAIRAEGGRPRFKLKTGTSDMNVVGPVWDCPIVAYGPGDSALDHTPDESIEVEEFRRAIEVLARALERLGGY
jgi:LysW-gamma-L-lysine carboxypeptidase